MLVPNLVFMSLGLAFVSGGQQSPAEALSQAQAMVGKAVRQRSLVPHGFYDPNFSNHPIYPKLIHPFLELGPNAPQYHATWPFLQVNPPLYWKRLSLKKGQKVYRKIVPLRTSTGSKH